MSIKRLSGAGLTTPKSNKLWDQVTFQSGMFAIATVSLTTTASSIVFSGIPSNYTHLQIKSVARYTGGVGSGFIAFNGDNASGNYSYHALGGDGNAPGTAALSSQNQGKFTGFAGTSPSANNVMVMDILDYANTSKYKTTRALYCWDANGTGYVEFNSNSWRSYSEINSITFTPANTFAANTHFALYGIKSA
jgi:hypothetical protein